MHSTEHRPSSTPPVTVPRAPRWRSLGTLAAVVALLLASLGWSTTASAEDAAAASTPWPGGRWEPAAPAYGMTVVTDVPVTASDGETLVVSIGYPASLETGERAPGEFPVLLTQNPYLPTLVPDSFFVSQGYIFVVADVRGSGRSGGERGLFTERDALDGVDLVHWAADELDGSNGVVGLTGCSYLGINQFFTAALVGPGSPLKAILPACASHSYEKYFVGGIPNANMPRFMGSLDFPEIYPDVVAGGELAYNGDYWQGHGTLDADVATQVVRNGIPALLWSGWAAAEAPPALELFTYLQNAMKDRPVFGSEGFATSGPMRSWQQPSGRYQIVIGPGRHGQGIDKTIQLEWYDTWLKGQRTDIQWTSTPLHLYESASDRWVNAARYPIVARSTPYFLAADGALSRRAGSPASDSITWAPPEEAGSSQTYTTSPFEDGATLAGPINLSVWASSSNTNLELVADVYDVAPDGTQTWITAGAVLGSLSRIDRARSWYDQSGLLIRPYQPFAADEYVPAGQTRRYDINVQARLWGLAPGHTLRLRLATQASTGATACGGAMGAVYPCLLTAPQQATLPGGVYEIEHGRGRPSALVLPLLAYQALPTATSGPTPTSTQPQPLDWG